MLLEKLLFLAFALFMHPVHVAISSVEIDSTGVVRVSHKFYIDDFSLLFWHLYEKNIKPSDSVGFSENELAFVNGYLNEAFGLRCSGEGNIRMEYEGKDQDGEYLWIKYKGQMPADFGSAFTLTDEIMFDLNFDQTNLVIVSCGKFEQGYTFNYTGKRSEEVRIE
jgi:hypothetical protein